MDGAVKGKLKEISDALERKKGSLSLFVCIRANEEKKWDIVVCASWVDYDRIKENIGQIFDEFKPKFNGEFGLLFSGIYPLKSGESFATEVIQLFGLVVEPKEVKDISIKGTKIGEMVLICSRPALAANVLPGQAE